MEKQDTVVTRWLESLYSLGLPSLSSSRRSGKKVAPTPADDPSSNDAVGTKKAPSSSSFSKYHRSVAKRVCHWFLPNSRVRLTWDVFIFVVIWYNSLVTPIRIFIMSGDSTPQSLVYADVVFDFIFVMTYFNVLRMIRILHLPSQFQELKRFRMQKGPVNESVFRMWIILFFTLLGMCILGCVYFGLSVTSASVDDVCPAPEEFVEDILSAEMWVAGDFVITDVMDPRVCGLEGNGNDGDVAVKPCNDCPQSLFFVRSIYFLMQTLFTIGYGDTVVPSKSAVEMALACIFMVIGVFGYGLIIANMTSVLANLDVVSMHSVTRWMPLADGCRSGAPPRP